MAAKFVVAVALIALCRANPTLINGEVYRDGRAYSRGEAYSNGGLSQALANVNGGAAQAFGSSSNGGQLARDGYYHPGGAVAQAQASEVPDSSLYGTAKAVAQNDAYYTVPAPATVITYQQNFAAPSDASVASAFSKDGGAAESSAKTGLGSFGQTVSNAKSYGPGSAGSAAKTGYGSTSTSANTQGQGSASSSAQTNGVADVVYRVAPVESVVPTQQQPIVIDAKSPIFYTSYAPRSPAQGVASANANTYGSGKAASSAKITHGRTISWRFGSAYDYPAGVRAVDNTQLGFGGAKSTTYTHGDGSAKSYANSLPSGPATAESSAASHGAGSANANANVNGAAYGNVRYVADVPTVYSGGYRSATTAQTQGSGNAASSARSQGANTANSIASSYGSGSARADALTV